MGSYECDSCTRCFESWKACQQHMNALGHWRWPHECDTCYSRFSTLRGSVDHMNKKDHWSYPYDCETCDLAFRSEDARDRHQNDEGHYKDLHCSDCDRYFRHANNLAQHTNSRVHRGSTIACPFCQTTLTTASGVIHHVETSACPKARNLDRNVIHRGLRQLDHDGKFTERLLEWHDGNSINATWNPNRAYNGSGYECYICHREFCSTRALEQHLRSPVHQAPLYHCPNKNGKCSRRFPTLAALFNHFESESCGYTKFETVQKNVGGFLTGGGQRLIQF
ncbi:hypothetical protein D6D17_09860 [Aureobasidium pullulans]|nr:hypothetical protein D6D17_09860 [Aureobasidium pullulans]